jgi:ParB-like chromosome segregation protein Spo0J
VRLDINTGMRPREPDHQEQDRPGQSEVDSSRSWLTVPRGPVEMIPVGQLTDGLSPRSTPCSEEHVKLLGESLDELPPILVHQVTMAVIDGVHRLEAFRRAGRVTIAAVLFSGSRDDAIVLAVQANVRHGLPLSLSDRRRAATEILAAFPGRSDRSIAKVTGLSHTTVAALRAARIASSVDLGDNHGRGIDTQERRRRIIAAASEHPNATIREIARHAGAAPSTVHAVLTRRSPRDMVLSVSVEPSATATGTPPTADAALGALREWLSATDVAQSYERYVDSVPLGRLYAVADEARRRAVWWAELAGALELRARQRPGSQ